MHSTCLGLLCIWQCLKYFYFFESRTKWFFYNLLLFETDVLSWHLNYEGGWSWFGMAWGGMDPTDFNVNWTHPTKIPPITTYGAIVQKCQKSGRSPWRRWGSCPTSWVWVCSSSWRSFERTPGDLKERKLRLTLSCWSWQNANDDCEFSRDRGGEIVFQKCIKNRVASLKSFSLTSPKVPKELSPFPTNSLQWSSLLAHYLPFWQERTRAGKRRRFWWPWRRCSISF